MCCEATARQSRAASTAYKRSRKPAAGGFRGSWCRPSPPLRPYPRNICRKDRPWCLRLRHPDHLNLRAQEFSMSKTAITSPELTPPVGPFSQAIEVDGFLYLSGQVGQDPTTGKLIPGGVAAETEQVFLNAA